jgi:hypothetical protein
MTEAAPVFRRDGGLPYDPNSERQYHRLTTIRSTSIKNSDVAKDVPLYLGRLTHYYAKAGHALARRVVSVPVECSSLKGERSGELKPVLRKLSINIFQVPSGRVCYGVTVDASVASDCLIALLEDCYYESFTVVTTKSPVSCSLTDLVKNMFRQELQVEEFRAEPDLHQLLFLSPTLSGLGIAFETVELQEEMLLALVYRVYDPMRDGFTSVCFPRELNRGWDAIGAVGSFVSVLCGHQDYIENAAVLSAALTVAALSDLRETQDAVLESMRLIREDTEGQDRGQRRIVLGNLSEQLAELQMNLSQHVESVADIGLWIPSLRVEDYHRSLVDCVRLVERSDLIGKSISRLTAIATAKAQALDTLDGAVNDHRRRSWALVAALLSTIAIPVSFILAFFSINAPQEHPNVSIFNLQVYLPLYLFAFGMIGLVGLVVAIFWYAAHPLRGAQLRLRADTKKGQQGPGRTPGAIPATEGVAGFPGISLRPNSLRYRLVAFKQSSLKVVHRWPRQGSL